MGDVHVIQDNGLQLLLSRLRDQATPGKAFRKALNRVGYLMTHHILAHEFSTYEKNVVTPVGTGKGGALDDRIVLVDVMRAARHMVEGATDYLDDMGIQTSVGIIDAKRGKMTNLQGTEFETQISTFKPPLYTEHDTLIAYDPMLATAGTQTKILERLKEHKIPKKTIVCCLLASQYGIDTLQSKFPEVTIYTLAIDKDGPNGNGLNEKGYIVPGLGDAGDRSHGT